MYHETSGCPSFAFFARGWVLCLDQFAPLTNRYTWRGMQRNGQMIAGMFALPCSNQSAFVCQFDEIARGCCRRSPRDLGVVASAEATSETFWAFLEHAQKRLFLSVVELTPQPLEHLCLIDQELNQSTGASLRLNRHTGKPSKPLCNLILLAGSFKSTVVAA